MKLTKNKWVNLAILKIAEGLGVVFIPYLVGSIPLAIWPELANYCAFDFTFEVWFFGLVIIISPVSVIALAWTAVKLNLEWAKGLKRD